MEIVEIKLQSTSEELGSSVSRIQVEQITKTVFRMIDNDIINESLTLGTEFETKLSEKGVHEIVSIVKRSPYVTKRYMLSPKYKESDYRIIGEQITKNGGHWQVDFGSVIIVNIPLDYLEAYECLMQELNVDFMET